MKKILFLILLSSSLAGAQDKVGNGGNIWACYSGNQLVKGVLMDLFEARKEFGLTLLQPSTQDPMALVQERAAFIKANWPEMNQEWAPVLSDVLSHFQLVTEPLQKVGDSFPRIRPGTEDGCQTAWVETQFANYTNLGHILVSRELWEEGSIPPMDKAALIWHEVVYRWLRDNQQETDSIRTRVVVGLLFSNLPLAEMKTKILEKLKPKQDPSKKISIKLREPFDGAVISGTQQFLFSVEAPLTIQPTVYLFAEGGAILGRALIAPYQVKWDTTKYPNGLYKVWGSVYTPEGTADTSPIMVKVQN